MTQDSDAGVRPEPNGRTNTKTPSSEPEPLDPDSLRLFLPTAIASAVALRDLIRMRRNYPGVLEDAEAKAIHNDLIEHFESAIEAAGLQKIHGIYKRPDFEDLGADSVMFNVFVELAMNHPDFRIDVKEPKKVQSSVNDLVLTCQEAAVEPVRQIIERLLDTMLVDCRIPNPENEPSFTEPNRFLQMLRMYWQPCRHMVFSESNSRIGYRPHRLLPLIVNLKDRISQCCDALAEQEEIPDIRKTITGLLHILLEGEVDDLAAVNEWAVRQLQQVDTALEMLRLELRSGTYPLTHEEDIYLRHAEKLVADYDTDLKKRWASMLKSAERQATETKKSTDAPSAATTFSQPDGQAKPESQFAGSVPQRTESRPPKLEPFSGGEIIFFSDRVELCGVDICSGPRCQTRRRILDLLRKKRSDGSFVGFSSEQIAEQVKLKGGQGAAAGAIRDLRGGIMESLKSLANLQCGRFDVILSGGRGYRFSEKLSVQVGDDSEATVITDMDDTSDVPNVRNGNVRDVRNDAVEIRRTWILRRLGEGDQLQAPAVAKQFKCSVKTAQRDLRALREEGRIEFVGTPRTGYYQLRNPPESDE